ncbi:hypothetical protein Aph01nite_49260 [Acrocarpospora phusangensis]|uniref:Squamosa promoter-binding protein 15 n=2 Tax=Acrocarpospora phusangensis TaxID=1070424 RepID=A0A919QEU0_9ACTN|nr:hypothetical protein Aph01nite_49260 [Acrocarpospora phusangensis]
MEDSSVADNRLMSWVANMMVSIDPDDRSNVEALSEWLRTEAPLRDKPGRGCGFLREITGQDTVWGGWKYPECDVWAGALNHASLRAVLDHIARMPWRCPNALQVFVMDQEEFFFRVLMLRDGELRQYAPVTPGEEDPDFCPDDL